MRGRRPKPTALKVVQGTFRPDRANKAEPRPARNVPKPPEWISREGKLEWKRVAPELGALGLLTGPDRAAFACYCESYGRLVRAQRALRRSVRANPGSEFDLIPSKHGRISNPLHRIIRHAMSDVVRYATEFGGSPVSRSRINVERIRRTEERADSPSGPVDPGDEFFS